MRIDNKGRLLSNKGGSILLAAEMFPEFVSIENIQYAAQQS